MTWLMHGSIEIPKERRKAKTKRDSSRLQADRLAGAKAEEKLGLFRSE